MFKAGILFSLTAGVITAVALAASAVAVISTGTATAGGGLFMAGAAGGLSFRSYTCEYQKIKVETEKFDSALKLLRKKHNALTAKNKEARRRIDLNELK